MASKFTFDLNQPPPFDDHELPHEEEDIPVIATSSSSGNIFIELNEENHEIEYPIIELDVHVFTEDNDRSFSESSEEEIETEQTRNNATMTTNETRETIVHPQIPGGTNLMASRYLYFDVVIISEAFFFFSL